MIAPVRVLHSTGEFAPGAERVPIGMLLAIVAIGGLTQGLVMGMHDGRALQALYSGIKVPLLLLATTAVCLPSLYVLHLCLGVHDDFVAACRATLVVQAVAAIFLAACAPLIAVTYASSDSYPLATTANGIVYFGAALTAHRVLATHYRPLIARARPHRVVLACWLVLYVLVAIQLAWTMRPFIGWPAVEPSLFRAEAWGNAYVHVIDALRKLFRT